MFSFLCLGVPPGSAVHDNGCPGFTYKREKHHGRNCIFQRPSRKNGAKHENSGNKEMSYLEFQWKKHVSLYDHDYSKSDQISTFSSTVAALCQRASLQWMRGGLQWVAARMVILPVWNVQHEPIGNGIVKWRPVNVNAFVQPAVARTSGSVSLGSWCDTLWYHAQNISKWQ